MQHAMWPCAWRDCSAGHAHARLTAKRCCGPAQVKEESDEDVRRMEAVAAERETRLQSDAAAKQRELQAHIDELTALLDSVQEYRCVCTAQRLGGRGWACACVCACARSWVSCFGWVLGAHVGELTALLDSAQEYGCVRVRVCVCVCVRAGGAGGWGGGVRVVEHRCIRGRDGVVRGRLRPTVRARRARPPCAPTQPTQAAASVDGGGDEGLGWWVTLNHNLTQPTQAAAGGDGGSDEGSQ